MKVSIIVPAFNAESYILDALGSVRNQDYEPLEIIVVDDGSTDRTVELVRSAMPEVLIVSQKNKGASAARNEGLRRATGEVVCFLDSDDGWFPNKLKVQVAHLTENPAVGMVCHDWIVWNPTEQGVYQPIEPPFFKDSEDIVADESGWIYPQLLLDCLVHTSTVMIRQDIVKQAGFFDTSLRNGEDYEYWLKVSRLCPIHKLSGVYSFYRLGVAGSLTRNPLPINYEYEVLNRAIAKWGKEGPDGVCVDEKRLSRRLTKLSFDFAYWHYHKGSMAVAKKAFMQTLKHSPSKWRAYIYLVISTFRCGRASTTQVSR